MVSFIDPIINVLLFMGALTLMIIGAEWVADHGAKIAKKLGVSELVIGITLIAAATSFPELAVVVTSAFYHNSPVALGTIVGSNIANLGLVLGVAALMGTIIVGRDYLKEAFIMVWFTIFLSLLLLNGLGWEEGMVLILLQIGYFYYLLKIGRVEVVEKITELHEEVYGPYKWLRDFSFLKSLVYVFIGVFLVVVGASLILQTTTNIARFFSINEIIIAIMGIAVGTSLPELATSITAAKKGMKSMSVGNIIGSNIFNISILGVGSFFGTIALSTRNMIYDIPVMLLFSFLLLFVIQRKGKMTTSIGVLLLVIYVLYIGFQFIF